MVGIPGTAPEFVTPMDPIQTAVPSFTPFTVLLYAVAGFVLMKAHESFQRALGLKVEVEQKKHNLEFAKLHQSSC